MTIFDSIDDALSGSQVNASVTVEAGNLVSIGQTVAGLIDQPPADFGAFVQSLAEADLPDIDVGGDLALNLATIQDALPDDLGDIPGALLEVLGEIEEELGLGVLNVLADALAAVEAIHKLVTEDITCGIRLGPQTTKTTPTPAAPGNGGNGGNGGIDEANAALDILPSPLTVESLLRFIHDSVRDMRPTSLVRYLPVIDDFLDPLETLLLWEGMDAAQLLANFDQTLTNVATLIRRRIEAVMHDMLDELGDLSGQFGDDQLAQIADELAARLAELETAIEGGDISATGPVVAAANTRLDQLDALRATHDAGVLPPLASLTARVSTLPDDLEDRLNHVIGALQPTGTLGNITSLPEWQPMALPATTAETFGDLEGFLETYLEFFEDVREKIDFAALQSPLGDIITALEDTADQFDQVMVTVTLEVQELFGEVEAALDGIDTSQMMADAQAAIQSFREDLVTEMTAAFEPARTALTDVVNEIDTAADAFDPQSLVNALRDTLQSLVDVLDDPSVTGSLDTIQEGIQSAADQLEDLSFAAIADEVIAGIDEISVALGTINVDVLSDALKLALIAALEVLPDDIRPFTDPLIVELGGVVEQGPLPIFEQIEQQPALLLEKVTAFEPVALVGDSLSEPFSGLLAQMDAFQPSQLLALLEAEFDTFKQRLRDNADPALAIQPLATLYAELLAALDSLRPTTLLEPIEAELTKVIDNIVTALPADEIITALEQVVAFIDNTLALGDRFFALLERLRDMLAGLTGGAGQLQTWIDSVLSRIDSLADTSQLTTTLASVSAAVDSTTAGALTATWTASATPLLDMLNGLDPETRLASVVQAYAAIEPSAVEALPDSAEKTAILALLDRFDPAQDAFNASYRALADLRTALMETEVTLAEIMVQWDADYHFEGGVLACLKEPQATAAQLRQWIEESLQNSLITPLSGLFAALEPVQQFIDSLIGSTQPVLTSLQDSLAELLTGPNALGGLRDALQALIDRLRNINLSFLTDTLDQLFDNMRAKLAAVDPAQLAAALSQEFDNMLAALSLDLAVPPGSLDQVDATYQEVVDKLKALDPGKLIVDVVQPEYEALVLPLLEPFDLTPVLAVLTARIGGLEDELRAEMDRVNAAYQAMLDAAPDVSISLSLDVGVSF
jgi:hypothetical protein